MQSGAVADARAWGLDENSVEAITRQLDGDEVEGVWLDLVPVVEAFVAVGTQWRTGLAAVPDGFRNVFIGLDYAGARAGLEAAGIEVTPELWSQLRIMESAAAAALNGD